MRNVSFQCLFFRSSHLKHSNEFATIEGKMVATNLGHTYMWVSKYVLTWRSFPRIRRPTGLPRLLCAFANSAKQMPSKKLLHAIPLQ